MDLSSFHWNLWFIELCRTTLLSWNGTALTAKKTDFLFSSTHTIFAKVIRNIMFCVAFKFNYWYEWEMTSKLITMKKISLVEKKTSLAGINGQLWVNFSFSNITRTLVYVFVMINQDALHASVEQSAWSGRQGAHFQALISWRLHFLCILSAQPVFCSGFW